ncbi:MAG: DUF2142 domain-containing protein [Anaerolineae bacterium]|nr:DUF2142 domain-containing protein [Anaerolineae bacterium]
MHGSPGLPARYRLIWLMLLFAGLATCYTLMTPLFEAPDEVWHYAYVRYLVEKRALPPLSGEESGAYQEVGQPPLYYAVAALLSGWAPDDDLAHLMWHNPGFGYQAGGTVNDNKNMLIHTAAERFPWRGAVLAIRLARMAALAFGLLAVVGAWGLGREAFPEQPGLALGVAAAVALTPQFLFISGVVNNDSAAAATATLALWLLARILNHGVTLRRALLTGVAVGLAALTKSSLLLLVPLALIAVGVNTIRRVSSTRGVTTLLVLFLSACATGGWWYVRNAWLYHDPLAVQVHVNTPWGRTSPASLGVILSALPAVYRSFWGAFGWGHVEFPVWVYLFIAIGPALSLAGWVNALIRRRHTPGRRAILLLALAWWILIGAALLAWMRRVEAPHGRLLFPAIAAQAVLLVGGWAALPRIPVLPVALTFLVVLNLLTPPAVIWPAFAPPALTAPAEAARTVQGTELFYGNVARLLGVSLDRASVSPGEVLKVRACWEGLAAMKRDYTVFVHLVGRDNMRVGERHTYPGLGRFPTSLWPPGRAFCDLYRVRVVEWAPVPELYDVVVGLYDAETGERLPVHAPDGAEVGLPILTQVRVALPRAAAELPEDARPVNYRLGERIALVGYQVAGEIRSGELLTVTLYWQAIEPPEEDYVVFVHLLGGGSAKPLAQDDSPPRAGRYPTSAWQAGEVIPDEHVLALPPLGVGDAQLGVGMYRRVTLERLPVTGPDGPLPDGIILLR